MTDLKLAASPAATVLAGLLVSADPQPSCAAYHGALTPAELDARPAEIEALISGAAVHDLGWLRRVAVRGKDRFRWLSGMVTNMVKDLPSGSGAWNLVLNAQGRIQGDLTVWRDNDDLELEIAADQIEKLLAHLDRFIIMDDVELVPLEEETAIGLTGPKAGEVLVRLGLPVLSEPMTQARVEVERPGPASPRLRRSRRPLRPLAPRGAGRRPVAGSWSGRRKARWRSGSRSIPHRRGHPLLRPRYGRTRPGPGNLPDPRPSL